MKYIFIIFLCIPLSVFGDDTTGYEVKKIKPELLLHAHAVIRDYNMEVDIDDLKEVVVKEHYAITILNEKGDKYANCSANSSSLETIEKIYGNIIDSDGYYVKKIRQSDFSEAPLFAAYPFLSDNKVKFYRVSRNKYPYTVEYTIEKKQNHTFYLPSWSPQTDLYCSVENASLTVKTSGNVQLRSKQLNTDIAPEVTTGDKKIYHWQLRNIPAREKEPLSYSDNYVTPTVLLALNEFTLGDFSGDMNSWKDFGKFIYNLNKARDVLPEDVTEQVKKLTAGITDNHKKVSVLYTYLQDTKRYVAVEYGIGGWQTLEASNLAKNQYGDCKALSNYMMALLAAAGITAYPVAIRAGADNEFPWQKDFVCSQANHVILCVPLTKDTVWLECTSNELPAGYLGDFTQNRDALMITPEGGVIVHTPVYDTSVNVSARHAHIACTDDKILKINMDNLYSGHAATGMYHLLKSDDDDDRDKYIRAKFHLANYTVDKYKYERADILPFIAVREHADITARGMVSKTGSRTFISIDAIPVQMAVPDNEGTRETPFYLPQSYAVRDTFELQIPDTDEVEFMPDPISLHYPFGSYFCTIKKTGKEVVMTRRFVINSGVYKPGLFENYVKLITEMNNASHKKVVFRNKS